MLRVMTGAVVAVSLVVSPVLAQTTTSTVLSGEAFGFEVVDSTTPDPFTFTSRSNIDPNGIDVASNIITISGITEPVTASVSDLGTGGVPKISVNGALYTAGPVTVSDGDSLRVSVLPVTGAFNATYRAEVTIGGGSAVFQVVTRAADTTPDAFTFLAATNQDPGQVISSPSVTITGIEATVAVSVSGSAGTPQISLDGGTTWVTSGSVANGRSVSVRLTSGTFGETRTATVTVGGVSSGFGVTTRSSNDNPVFAAFGSVTAAEPVVTVTSAPVTVTGIETSVSVSVSGDGLPQFQVNEGVWVSAGSSASVATNDTLRVRLTSGAFGVTHVATLNVNGTPGTFTVTTRAADTTPNAFTLAAITEAAAGALISSAPVTITGIETPAAVTISGDGTPSFSTDNGTTWIDTKGSGTVSNGGQITVRLTSGTFDATRVATLTVGGVTRDFSVTSQSQDATPDAFTFDPGLALAGVRTESGSAVIAGFNGSVPISVSGDGSPEYRIGTGTWTSASGSLSAGQQVQVRLTASSIEGATRSATLSVGTGSGTFTVETQDVSPSAFTLAAVTSAQLNTVIESGPVTISGVTGYVPVSVEAAFSAEYRIGSGGWTSAPGTVQNGQTVTVRFRSSSEFATERSVSLTVGTVTRSFSVTTPVQDTAPDLFAFNAALVAAGAADVASDPVTLTGFDGSVPISVSGDGSPEYRIGTGTWTSVSGSLSSGQQVQVRLTSSSTEGASRSATLSVGSGSATFTVEAQDFTPSAFTLAAVTGAQLNTVIESAPVTISGVTGSVPVSVQDAFSAEYRIGSGGWTSAPGTVQNGQTVTVRFRSSSEYATERTVSLTVGTVTRSFSVTTPAQDATPDLFAFNAALPAPGAADVASDPVTLTGFDGSVAVTVSGHASAEFRIGTDVAGTVTWGAWGADPGSATSGQLAQVRLDASASEGVIRNATLSVGTRSATYAVTTQELTPDLFAFSSVTGAAPGVSVTSDPVRISGVTGSVPVSVSEGNNALFRVGTGPDAANIVWWSEGFVDHTATGKTLVNDRWVQVRLTSSGAYETARTATLNVGSGSAGFSVTTGSEPVSITISTGTVPDAEAGLVYAGFDFKTRAGVTGGPTAGPATVADLSWSVSGGAVPTGMTLSTAGVLGGTPTQIGSFAFTVRAAIGADVATASYTIIVNDPNGSFVIEGG